MGSDSNAAKSTNISERAGIAMESEGHESFPLSPPLPFSPSNKQSYQSQATLMMQQQQLEHIDSPELVRRIPRVPLPTSSHRKPSSVESNPLSWDRRSSHVSDIAPPPAMRIHRKEVKNSLVSPQHPSSPNSQPSPSSHNNNDQTHRSLIASVGGLTTLPSMKSNARTISPVSPRQSMAERLEVAKEWARLGLVRGFTRRSKESAESNRVSTGEGELEDGEIRRVKTSKSGKIVEGRLGRFKSIIEEDRGKEKAEGLEISDRNNGMLLETEELGKKREYNLGVIGINPLAEGSFQDHTSGIRISRKPAPIRILPGTSYPSATGPPSAQAQQGVLVSGTFLSSSASTELGGSNIPQQSTVAGPTAPMSLIPRADLGVFHTYGAIPGSTALQNDTNNATTRDLDTPAPVPEEVADVVYLVSNSSVVNLRGHPTNEYEAGWDGPDDPDNPLNWNVKKKCFNTIIVGMYSAVINFNSSVCLPAHQEIQTHFNVSSTIPILGFSLYLFGLSFGPLLGESLSSFCGRKILYGVSLPLSALLIMGSGLSQTIAGLLLCRFFAALFAGPAVAVGQGMIADMWGADQVAVPTMVYLFLQFGATIAGPILGAYAVQFNGWQWTSWLALIFSGIIYMASYFISETHSRVILAKRDKRRERKRRTEDPPSHMSSVTRREYQISVQRHTADLSRSARRTSPRKHCLAIFVLPLRILIFEPLITALSVYMAITFGILVHALIAFPYVFQTFYSFNLLSSNLVLLSILFGFFMSFCFEVGLNRTVYRAAQCQLDVSLGRAAGGRVPPEEKLWGILLGSILLPISLFTFGWTSSPHGENNLQIHASVPIALGGITMGFAAYSIIAATSLYLVETFDIKPHPSAAIQGLFFLTYFVAALSFPMFTLVLYQDLGAGKAGSILGAVSVILAVVPWCVWLCGRDFRGYGRGEIDSRKSVSRREKEEGQTYGWKVRVFCERERIGRPDI